MSEVSFRIAHLSDLHLAEVPEEVGFHDRSGVRHKAGLLLAALTRANLSRTMSSYGKTYLRALSRALAGRSPYTQPYDGFVVTGDLATTGATGDIAAAYRYFSGRLIPGSADPSNPPFKFPEDRLAVFPGNHDRYLGRNCAPRSAEFESGTHFGGTWDVPAKKHSAARSTVNTSVIWKQPGLPGLGIVGADFSLPSESFVGPPFLHLGRGRVRRAIVDKMLAETKQLRAQGCGVVWATHFPPVSGPRSLALAGYQAVVDAAASAKVGIILSGHTHEPDSCSVPAKDGSFSGIRVLTAGTPCTAGEGERSYYELNLTVHQSVSGPGVRLDSYQKMIYFELPQRNWAMGMPGNIGEFLPAY